MQSARHSFTWSGCKKTNCFLNLNDGRLLLACKLGVVKNATLDVLQLHLYCIAECSSDMEAVMLVCFSV